MSKSFYRFSQAEFESRLNGILYANRAGFMSDITGEFQENENRTWERIYRITTKNPSVDLIVFSSVDIRTNSARDNGNDRVRLVMRWKTEKGEWFRRVNHHNRIRTLFDNVEVSILKAQSESFNCKRFKWSPKLED